MRNTNNKGFTLVELLAVIVILAIIVVLAITKIRDFLDKSNTDAVVTNANVLVKAVNDGASTSRLTGNYTDGTYGLSDLYDQGLSLSGTKPDEGYVTITDGIVTSGCLKYGQDYAKIENSKVSYTESCSMTYFDEVTTFAYTGSYQTFTAPATGQYKIQVWGAEGGQSVCNGSLCGNPGKGGYAEGIISLNVKDKLYVYVGQKGSNALMAQNTPSSFNGGGYGTSDTETGGGYESSGAGGGATDVRLVSGDWFNSEGLASRIIVAGGGGGTSYAHACGAGGGLVGGNGNNATNAPGGTQTTGYAFGYGKNGEGVGDSDGVAGGGGGYWGGTSYNAAAGESASGGSGYISGHQGCVAITSSTSTAPISGCTDGTTDISCSYHYSGKKFTNTVLQSGTESIPTHDGTSTMTGNAGDGYAVITYIG